MEDDKDIVRFWYCHSRLRGKALSQVTPWVRNGAIVRASSYDTGMEWETAPEVRVASASRTYVKRVSKDMIKARKEKGLYLRYGNTSH